MMSSPGVADLGLVHQVALGEHRAAGGDRCGVLRGQGDAAEVLHLHAQPPGLGGQKDPVPRRAEGVHGIVGHHPLIQEDDLAVLSPDLKDRAHVRVQGEGAPRRGR